MLACFLIRLLLVQCHCLHSMDSCNLVIVLTIDAYCTFCIKCIDAARDLLDTELTARAGESYNRAYGVRKEQKYAFIKNIFFQSLWNKICESPY